MDALMHGTDEEMSALVSKVQSFLARRRWRQATTAVRAANRLMRRVVARRALSALALRGLACVWWFRRNGPCLMLQL